MAHTFVNKANALALIHTDCSYAFDCGTASLLVVGITADYGPRITTAPTFNGIALTLAAQASLGSGGAANGAELWYLVNPPLGSYTLLVPNSGTGATSTIRVVSSSYLASSGKISTYEAYVTRTGTGTTISDSITTIGSGCVIVDILKHDTQTALETSYNQTLLYHFGETSTNWNDSHMYALQTSAGAITFTHVEPTSQDWVHLMVAFSEAVPNSGIIFIGG